MARKKKNKNKVLIIGIVSVVVVLAVVLLIVLLNGNKKEIDAIYAGRFNDSLEIEDTVITSYEDYTIYFDEYLIDKDIFKDYNYAVIELEYDECRESDVKLVDYSLNGKELHAKFTYTGSCGLCAREYLYYLVPVDKKVKDVEFDISYEMTNVLDCPRDVAYKPIIYLYPKEDTNINVRVGNPNYLTSTYPKYNDGWEVFAKTNGDLYDANGRLYYGLYWEGNNHITKIEKDGFVVAGSDTLEFLEEKLSILGLTEREADEFIIYWLPKLEVNKYNYIRFETKEEINSYMPLLVSPNPDSIIRVMMDYKPLDERIDVQEQILNTPERVGFVLVEWGGSLIK